VPYHLWRSWVESQKGPVTETLLNQPDEVEGLEPLGLLLRFKKHNDFGHYLTGEIRGYCRAAPDGYSPLPGTCRYLLRRAYVPLGAEDYDATSPVSEWTQANFDAPALARHFRAIGLGPGTDWWLVGRDKLFAAAPSPREVLAANAVVVRLDSVECPEMGKAIEALEGKPVDAVIDLTTVGNDENLIPPAPHAVIADYTFYLRAGGDLLRMEGSRGPVAEMAMPILDAADRCEQARAREG